MDRVAAPPRHRVDSRNRRAHYTLTQTDARRSLHEKEADPADEPLLIREHKRRTIMTNSHRRFHRRAPQDGTNVRTVGVEVVATIDTAGNVVAQTTVTQDSAAPAEPTQVLPLTDVSAASAAPDVAAPAEPVPTSEAPLASVPGETLPGETQLAPATPSETAVPAVPSTPSEAAVPDVPSAPSDPSAPSTLPEPSVASVPSAPAEPTAAAAADVSVAADVSAAALPSVSSVPAEPSLVLPSVPAVPAMPSFVLPSVPSVPAFPSTLTVPAYPFATPGDGEVVAAAAAVPSSSSSSSSSSVTATSEPSIVGALTAATESANSTTSISSSTSSISSSILASSPTLLSSMSGFTYTSSPAAVASQTGAVGGSPSEDASSGSSPSTTPSSARATPTESLDAAGSSSFYGAGGPGWDGGSETATAASPSGTGAAAAADDTGTPGPLATPQVVGSVVGSLAGAALILAIILMLLRRHKRRQGGALQLTDSHPANNEQAMRQVQAPQQIQAPVQSRASLVPSGFLDRFSGMSRSTADTTSPTERSFQRVSGRKLPSAFSEGMTSDQVARGGHMSDSSFYQDERSTWGAGALSKEYGKEYGSGGGGGASSNPFNKEIGDTPGVPNVSVRPSPARTPVIHHPNENPFDDTNRTLSPPMSPNPFMSPADPPLRSALGRSLHSADGSRSSRFTENV